MPELHVSLDHVPEQDRLALGDLELRHAVSIVAAASSRLGRCMS
jgi:hypothetical protein